jgi:sterol desaturase/sphingolipid hydroxylase (fatty acid hydroxylase superfamily)
MEASMVQLLGSDQGRLLELALLCGALWAVESVVPLYRYPGGRLRHGLPNIALTALVALTSLFLSFGSAGLVAWAGAQRLGLLFLHPLPPIATVAIGVVTLDGLAYAAHVVLHKSDLGWRFHRVHHCDPCVDVTTAFRQHPGETVWRIGWQLAGTVILGLPLWALVVYLVFSTTNAQLEHANVRMSERIDRWLRLVFVTPHMHKTHHSRDPRETDSNYSNILSLWDRLFRTYTPRVEFGALRYGLDGMENDRAASLGTLLGLPFRS